MLSDAPSLLSQFGVRLDEVTAGLSFEPAALADPENRVPYRCLALFLERCALRTGCAHFGLLLGSRSDHRSLGFVGQLMANAPTLAAALGDMVALRNRHSPAAASYLCRSGQDWLLGYGVYDANAIGQQQIYPLIVALMANSVRGLTGGAVRPLEILLSIREPRDAAPFKALLPAPIHFDQPETGLLLSCAALEAPIVGASPEIYARLQASLRSRPAVGGVSWAERVRHTLRVLLAHGEPTSEKCGLALDLHVRTLSRNLKSEGTSFRRILDGTRFAMACDLLTVTDLPVGAISEALCYAAPPHFAEAFQRWTGMSPTAWVKQRDAQGRRASETQTMRRAEAAAPYLSANEQVQVV